MFGIKDHKKWLDKPETVLKDVLSKPSRRTHPYIHFGYSSERCIDTGHYVLGNAIEVDYAQHDPQQSLSTIRVSDDQVKESLKNTLISMFPEIVDLPPGSLHLNNLMSAYNTKTTLRNDNLGLWYVDNPRNGKEPITIFQPALSKHFMDRFTIVAEDRRQAILASDMAFPYSEFDPMTQSGRLILHNLSPTASPTIKAVAKSRITGASFVGFDLISPNVSKHISPSLVIVPAGDGVYTIGSKYTEDGIELTMSRPFNHIFTGKPL